MARKDNPEKPLKPRKGKPPLTLDDPGGESVSVEIKVNGIVVFRRDAVITGVDNNRRSYKIDDGDRVLNGRFKGIKDLAVTLIEK